MQGAKDNPVRALVEGAPKEGVVGKYDIVHDILCNYQESPAAQVSC